MMEVSVSKVDNPAECTEVLPLYEEFQRTVPLNEMFGYSPRQGPEPKYGPEDFLIVAKDREGNIVGFASNKVNATVIQQPDPTPERLELEEFLKFVEKKDQMDRLPQRCIELRVLAVTEQWRGRGVARRLVEGSVAAARAAGFRSMTMCCVNDFTARLARSLGWTEHYRLAYSDYPRLSGRDVRLKPNPPHDHVCCYYTQL